MIMEKTSLERKFNQINGAAPGKILKFNEDGNLIPVDPKSEGLLSQVKIEVPSNYTITCSPESSSYYSINSIHTGYKYWFFNLPRLDVEYTFYIGVSGSTPTTRKITPTSYRQYQVSL